MNTLASEHYWSILGTMIRGRCLPRQCELDDLDGGYEGE
jgi:hypothetical protein